MTILKKTFTFRLIASWILVSFIASAVLPPAAYAQAMNLPASGAMVLPTPAFMPVMIKGVKVHPENPLLFDFIIDTGNSVDLTKESPKVIKYFLAALTIKEDDLWVNLSPYEKNRMIPQELGKTELGADMLAQDYILKQLTASLIYPEKDLGKAFWSRIYAEAQKQFGATDIPMDTFNKVWIVADKAKVFEHNNAAYVIGSHLKVMLESDYTAAANNTAVDGSQNSLSNNLALNIKATEGATGTPSRELAKNIIREIIIPEIEKEVNQGKNFAPLRQMYYSMILASWYKKALKDALLNQVYSNKGKISGVLSNDPAAQEKIYDQYLQSYKKGVFNYIKEDLDTASQQPMPRKYFSGGLSLMPVHPIVVEDQKSLSPVENAMVSSSGENFLLASVRFAGVSGEGALLNKAMDGAVDGRQEFENLFFNALEGKKRLAKGLVVALGRGIKITSQGAGSKVIVNFTPEVAGAVQDLFQSVYRNIGYPGEKKEGAFSQSEMNAIGVRLTRLLGGNRAVAVGEKSISFGLSLPVEKVRVMLDNAMSTRSFLMRSLVSIFIGVAAIKGIFIFGQNEKQQIISHANMLREAKAQRMVQGRYGQLQPIDRVLGVSVSHPDMELTNQARILSDFKSGDILTIVLDPSLIGHTGAIRLMKRDLLKYPSGSSGREYFSIDIPVPASGVIRYAIPGGINNEGQWYVVASDIFQDKHLFLNKYLDGVSLISVYLERTAEHQKELTVAERLQGELYAPESTKTLALLRILNAKQRGERVFPHWDAGVVQATVPGTTIKVSLLSEKTRPVDDQGKLPLVFSGDAALGGIVAPVQVADHQYQGFPIAQDALELKIAFQTVQSLMAFQAPNGGIYLASQETLDAIKGHPRDISNAHTVIVCRSFQLFLDFIKKYNLMQHYPVDQIEDSMKKMKDYLFDTGFDKENNIFFAGGYFETPGSESFTINPHYATDAQALDFSPAEIDERLGHLAAYKMWESMKARAGQYTGQRLTGMGLVEGHTNRHAGMTIRAIRVGSMLAQYYGNKISREIDKDVAGLRAGISNSNIWLTINGKGFYAEATEDQELWWGAELNHQNPDLNITISARLGNIFRLSNNGMKTDGVDESFSSDNAMKSFRVLSMAVLMVALMGITDAANASARQLEPEQLTRDFAMNAKDLNGGIDLNAKKMGLDVTRDGKGVVMNFDPAMIVEFQKDNFTGVEGIILKIVPIRSPLIILGMKTNPG